MRKTRKSILIAGVAICIICATLIGFWLSVSVISISPIQVMFTSEITPQCKDRAYVDDTADYIIEGTVERIKVEHPGGRKTPITYNNVKIEKYIKGDIKKSEIQIVVDWAQLGAIHTQLGAIPDYLYPSFHEGERVRIYFEMRNEKYFITCSVFGIEKIEQK
jgi:hypothetical protein